MRGTYFNNIKMSYEGDWGIEETEGDILKKGGFMIVLLDEVIMEEGGGAARTYLSLLSHSFYPVKMFQKVSR